MKAAHHLALLVLLALASSVAFAFDPSPLQDFCVAINENQTTNGVFVNGKFCKDPKLVNADDFFFSGLKEGDTSGSLGYISTLVDVTRISGLNTLGISLSRLDFAPKGLNPPHMHPRATEILVVLEGTLQVGFISSNPENHLFTKVLNKGDVFVFPISHIHFLLNVGDVSFGKSHIGDTKAVAISGLSSQNPGLISIAKSVFGSNPPIAPEILAKAFHVNQKIINYLEKQF